MNLFVMEWRRETRGDEQQAICSEVYRLLGMSPFPAHRSKKEAASDILALAQDLRRRNDSRTLQIHFPDDRSVPPPHEWKVVTVIFDDTQEQVTIACIMIEKNPPLQSK